MIKRVKETDNKIMKQQIILVLIEIKQKTSERNKNKRKQLTKFSMQNPRV